MVESKEPATQSVSWHSPRRPAQLPSARRQRASIPQHGGHALLRGRCVAHPDDLTRRATCARRSRASQRGRCVSHPRDVRGLRTGPQTHRTTDAATRSSRPAAGLRRCGGPQTHRTTDAATRSSEDGVWQTQVRRDRLEHALTARPRAPPGMCANPKGGCLPPLGWVATLSSSMRVTPPSYGDAHAHPDMDRSWQPSSPHPRRETEVLPPSRLPRPMAKMRQAKKP